MRKELSYALKRSRLRNNRGFTIAEMLIVVAILIILFAVGFIAGNEIIKSTRQKNMDKRAEVIYYAAESRMMELFVTKTEKELQDGGIKGGDRADGSINHQSLQFDSPREEDCF